MSIATVSRVFNDSGPVNEETRATILDVARRLRYMPHGAARSLITSKTHTLGVLLPDLYGEFFSEVIRGIDLTARRAGYHILLSSSHAERAEVEAALQAMRGRVDGMLIMHPDIDNSVLRQNLSESIRVVLLSSTGEAPSFSMNVDNYGGAHAAVTHLADHGHTRIAIICGDPANFDATERLRAYRDVLADRGLPACDDYVAIGDFTEVSGYRAAGELLGMDPRPTAVFASNDAMAIGALGAFREADLHVPDDLAVIGFDDIPISRYVTPPLTSVHVAISELGARATEWLIDTVQDPRPGQDQAVIMPATLVIRRSCGCRMDT